MHVLASCGDFHFTSNPTSFHGICLVFVFVFVCRSKSTLVNQIKKPLAEKNGCFIEGKFDISARPDKVLASALDAFFANIITASSVGENTFMSMRWRINDAIGSGVSCLFDAIPSLRKFMGTEADRSEGQPIGDNLMGKRLTYMLFLVALNRWC